jgi:hypothetical protein
MLMSPHLGCQVKTQPDTFSSLNGVSRRVSRCPTSLPTDVSHSPARLRPTDFLHPTIVDDLGNHANFSQLVYQLQCICPAWDANSYFLLCQHSINQRKGFIQWNTCFCPDFLDCGTRVTALLPTGDFYCCHGLVQGNGNWRWSHAWICSCRSDGRMNNKFSGTVAVLPQKITPELSKLLCPKRSTGVSCEV